jgi:hypothetical protein
MTDSRYFSSDFCVFGDKNGFLPSMPSCMRELDRYGDEIRRVTPDLDFLRVLFVRGRRMMLLSVALLEQHVESYGPWIRFLDSFVQVFAVYQAVILIPRFWMNLLYVGRHMDSQVSDEIDKMGKMCWDMAYDFGWIITGALSFFVLVGPLAPCALYLAVATPTYHLLMHLIRLAIAYAQGKTLDSHYDDLMRLMVRVGVSVCIVSAAVVILVCCTNPVLAFTAAAVAVLATIAGRMLPDYLSEKKPETPLIKQSMFATSAPAEEQTPEETVDLVAS